MSVGIGIIGLAKSGRTTIFNALTRSESSEKYTEEGSVSHIGAAKVPDARLQALADMLHPRSVVPASATYIDIGASVKTLVEGKGIRGQLLAQLSNVDALIHVVRAFEDESIPHVEGSLDIDRDIANMDLELALSDLLLLDRRRERIELSLKAAKQSERQGLLREQELLMKIRADLEKDVPIRQMALATEGARAVAGFQFLTAKPLLIVVNIGEDGLPKAESLAAELGSRYSRPHCQLTTACGKLEMELARLDNGAADELRAEYGMKESAADRVVRLSYELLGLISFFTTASAEVKAWSVKSGTDAVKAAGKVHSDMERGFIRAEVISYDDLVSCGSLPEGRKKGLLRREGKNYIVRDGDVITFLFNL